MADITLFTPFIGINNAASQNNGPIWTDEDTGYFFYIRDQASGRLLHFKKTTDGGASFGTEQDVTSMNGVGFGLWYDRWTSGDTTGNNIYIVDEDGAGQCAFTVMDTTDDSFSLFQTIVSFGTTDLQDTFDTQQVSITKARGGNLYAAFGANNSALNFFGQRFSRSTDGGTTWETRAQLIETNSTTALDAIILIPGNETDDQDIWAAYWDRTASEISLKVYDDSANSWSETSIATGMTLHGSGQLRNWQATTRHSDDHMILIAGTNTGQSTDDGRVWDINGSGSITEKANVFTNESNHIGVHIMCNQQNDDLYAGFFGSGAEVFATLSVYYRISSDGGDTWGSVTLFNEDGTGSVRTMWGDISIGAGGGQYQLAWADLAGSNDFVTNDTNSIAFASTGGSPVGVSAQVAIQQKNLLLL